MNREDIIIREARGDEWDKIPGLHRDEGEEYMEGSRERNKIRFLRIPKGTQIVLLAEQQGQVIGAIHLELVNKNLRIANGTTVAHFDDLVVDPDFRSNGIGTQLLQQGERILREKGFTQVTLGIRNGPLCNTLEHFYKRRGYALLFKKDDGESFIFTKNLVDF